MARTKYNFSNLSSKRLGEIGIAIDPVLMDSECSVFEYQNADGRMFTKVFLKGRIRNSEIWVNDERMIDFNASLLDVIREIQTSAQRLAGYAEKKVKELNGQK